MYANGFPNDLQLALETAMLEHLPSHAKVYMLPLIFGPQEPLDTSSFHFRRMKALDLEASLYAEPYSWGQVAVNGRRFVKFHEVFMAISE